MLRYEANAPVAGLLAVLERAGMTVEAALVRLRHGDPAGALLLFGEAASPAEQSASMPRSAWCCWRSTARPRPW